jgi:CheY-like chemotaxis protein
MSIVLVVDDNDVNRFVAAHMLEASGFAVIQASDGAEAVRLTFEQRPGVVVLDIQMPGMSGLEVLARIRGAADPAVAATRVIAATALAMAEDRQRCLAAGAARFIARPFSMKDLVDEVRALMPATDAANGPSRVAE